MFCMYKIFPITIQGITCAPLFIIDCSKIVTLKSFKKLHL
jgi:hypothetical protein